MCFGINLRGDLAKLSDAELAAELDRLCEYRNTRFGTVPRVGSLKGNIRYGPEWSFGRGPIYARWAYKIWIWYFGPLEGLAGPSIWLNAKSKICATKFSAVQG
jgi:hypothetical protein